MTWDGYETTLENIIIQAVRDSNCTVKIQWIFLLVLQTPHSVLHI